ncbi:hypothetical protein SAMN05216383_103230 [Prevotella sp. KH2C16]|nr:hypothetical protein SAMN05216383_103230 [Prevotella sp. KH2C16]
MAMLLLASCHSGVVKPKEVVKADSVHLYISPGFVANREIHYWRVFPHSRAIMNVETRDIRAGGNQKTFIKQVNDGLQAEISLLVRKLFVDHISADIIAIKDLSYMTDCGSLEVEVYCGPKNTHYSYYLGYEHVEYSKDFNHLLELISK